jgi:ribonuclease Z
MVDNHYWTSKYEFNNYTLYGFSWAARKTGFYIPEMRVMLDCGVPNDYSPEHIFITHGHGDHCFCLPQTIIDTGNVKPNIYIHSKDKSAIYQYIHSAYFLSTRNPKPKIHNKYNLVPCEENTINIIQINGKSWKIDIIKCFHTVPCIGYGFSEIRTRLLPEILKELKIIDEYIFTEDIESNIKLKEKKIQQMKTQKIIEYKKQEKNINEEYEHPVFCFLGDTNEFVLKNPILEKFKLIMIECTFLDDEHIKEANDNRHMHWINLKPYITHHPNTIFILYHFSFRYDKSYIKSFFEKQNIINVIPWI